MDGYEGDELLLVSARKGTALAYRLGKKDRMSNVPDIPSTEERTKILLCLTLCCLIAFTGESRAQFEVQIRAPGIYPQLDHDQFWRKITIVCEPKVPPGGAKPEAVPVTLEKDWIARVALKLSDVQKISWQLNEGNEWILYPPYDTTENRPNPVKTFYVTSYDKIRIDTIKALRSQIKASGKFKEANDELAKVEEVYRLAPTENLAEGVWRFLCSCQAAYRCLPTEPG